MSVENFAIMKHGDQKRKYTNEPYWHHLEEVAYLVEPLGYGAVSTAWLHDILEDTKTSFREIEDIFGEDIAMNVLSLSDLLTPMDGNRKFRKAKYRDFLSTCNSLVQSVKVADLISNSISIKRHDLDFAEVYLKEKMELLDVLTLANPVLLRIARGLL